MTLGDLNRLFRGLQGALQKGGGLMLLLQQGLDLHPLLPLLGGFAASALQLLVQLVQGCIETALLQQQLLQGGLLLLIGLTQFVHGLAGLLQILPQGGQGVVVLGFGVVARLPDGLQLPLQTLAPVFQGL